MILKVRRGQTYIHNGQQIWIENQKNSLVALACDAESRELTDNYFDVRLSQLQPVKKGRLGIQTKPVSKVKRTEKQIMNEFFESLYDKMPFLCSECGKPFHALTSMAKKSTCAHILPKANFDSIKTNPDNIMYLGASYIGQCGCHDVWDTSVEKRVKMKVYPHALIQFQKLIPHLTDTELIAAYEYLGIKISAEILQEIDIKNLAENGYSNNR